MGVGVIEEGSISVGRKMVESSIVQHQKMEAEEMDLWDPEGGWHKRCPSLHECGVNWVGRCRDYFTLKFMML